MKKTRVDKSKGEQLKPFEEWEDCTKEEIKQVLNKISNINNERE